MGSKEGIEISSMKRFFLRIGSERRESGRVDLIESPWSGEVVGELCVGSAADVDDAVSEAVLAFEDMRRLPTHRRTAILESTAHALEGRIEDLARLMARESGKPIRFARGEVKRAAITFRLAAGEARHFGGEVTPIDLEPRAEGRLCLHTRVPRGPVAAIAPFNFPLNLVAHKVAPAIAIGTSVVLKPAPQCPLVAHVLAEILEEAGLPDGALNVVHCEPQDAQRMVEDERIAVLSFTCSDAVGWRLNDLAGKKQVLLELGGNAPCVLDEGVDLDAALPAITAGAWAQAGQVCIKVQRLFVHDSLFDDFLQRFTEATLAVPCGDPLDEETVVGPLIEERHVARILEWVREAVAGGARLLCGGEAEGLLMRPTLLTGTRAKMRVCRDEIFGPVTVIERFGAFEDVLMRCNATRYGLQAGVFTPRIDHALTAFRELDYGGVMINDVPTFRVDNFPYGGSKDSGLGREGVRYAMEEMSEPKVLVLRGLS